MYNRKMKVPFVAVVKIFILTATSRPTLGLTQPPIQRIYGIKRTGWEAGHCNESNAMVRHVYGPIALLPDTTSWRSASESTGAGFGSWCIWIRLKHCKSQPNAQFVSLNYITLKC
jgi:hypothetical protein